MLAVIAKLNVKDDKGAEFEKVMLDLAEKAFSARSSMTFSNSAPLSSFTFNFAMTASMPISSFCIK